MKEKKIHATFMGGEKMEVTKFEVEGGGKDVASAVTVVIHLDMTAEEAEAWVEQRLAELLTAQTGDWHIEDIMELKGGQIHGGVEAL